MVVKVTGLSDGLDVGGGHLEQSIDVMLPFTSTEILQYNKIF